MTTGTEPSGQVDAAEVWRAIGRLESDTATLKEGQREIRIELRDGFQELRNDLKDVHRRIDRLLYFIIGVGGALIATILATFFLGG